MPTPRKTPVISAESLFVSRQTTGQAYGVGEETVLEFERRGWLTKIKIPSLRCVRHDWQEVKALAERLRRGELS